MIGETVLVPGGSRKEGRKDKEWVSMQLDLQCTVTAAEHLYWTHVQSQALAKWLRRISSELVPARFHWRKTARGLLQQR